MVLCTGILRYFLFIILPSFFFLFLVFVFAFALFACVVVVVFIAVVDDDLGLLGRRGVRVEVEGEGEADPGVDFAACGEFLRVREALEVYRQHGREGAEFEALLGFLRAVAFAAVVAVAGQGLGRGEAV